MKTSKEAAEGKVKVKKLQKRIGVRVMTTKGKLRAGGISDTQVKPIPAKAPRGYMLYGTIIGKDSRGLVVEFELFPAAEKTFTCGGDRLTIVPEDAEEPTMSERERKKIAVCFSKGNQPHIIFTKPIIIVYNATHFKCFLFPFFLFDSPHPLRFHVH